ncbi:hypothetical protein QEV83_17945 [Methylocapsa sp. D3K7]|uniref:hypothetical protein n=1 Tax=Methylocapsa sp. D3K7 TaxID=3041435 RepID=UPI00244E9F13|nr:hypothetical protein [Methylocapsa sp. D3K7]WGJ14485.1 hypothetical protein QEV83_17945 [Methylocapsa sp. D3K7]
MSHRKITCPVARYLDEFGSAPVVSGLDEASQDGAGVGLLEAPAAPDPEALLLAAREQGFDEGCAAAAAGHETLMAQERLQSESRLASERQRWSSQEGETLARAIKDGFAVIESNIAASVERVLAPFVVEALRRKMVELLAENLGVLLGGSEQPLVEIYGPEDLLAMLREKLGSGARAIAFSPESAIDVRIIAGQTMIESRMEAWLECIKSQLE